MIPPVALLLIVIVAVWMLTGWSFLVISCLGACVSCVCNGLLYRDPMRPKFYPRTTLCLASVLLVWQPLLQDSSQLPGSDQPFFLLLLLVAFVLGGLLFCQLVKRRGEFVPLTVPRITADRLN